MDARLAEAIAAAEYRISFDNQLETLKERTQQELRIFINGGSFTVTHELIAFLSTMCNMGRTQGVLLDDDGIPTRVDDMQQLLNNAVEKYFDVTNKYFADIANLKKLRGR